MEGRYLHGGRAPWQAWLDALGPEDIRRQRPETEAPEKVYPMTVGCEEVYPMTVG